MTPTVKVSHTCRQGDIKSTLELTKINFPADPAVHIVCTAQIGKELKSGGITMRVAELRELLRMLEA